MIDASMTSVALSRAEQDEDTEFFAAVRDISVENVTNSADSALHDFTVDKTESALLRAYGMIESVVSFHREKRELRSPALSADDAPIGDIVARLLGAARYSVSLSLPDDGDLASAAFALLAEKAPAPRSGAAPGRRIVRLLCTERALRAGAPSDAVLQAAGLEIRVFDGELSETLIADGSTALVGAGEDRADKPASLVKDPASVRVMDLLFAAAWAGARPLGQQLKLNERVQSAPARRILRSLSAGRTDDIAAQEVQVSLRTYRRHVANIMRELGVSSRFQAGVRAVELGLLPESRCAASGSVRQ